MKMPRVSGDEVSYARNNEEAGANVSQNTMGGRGSGRAKRGSRGEGEGDMEEG